jgi:hypothetical protein
MQRQSSTSVSKFNVNFKGQVLFKCSTSVECCLFYLIDKSENGWKFYGNHWYLFRFSKINWHEAKVSKIVINKQWYIVYISIAVEDPIKLV